MPSNGSMEREGSEVQCIDRNEEEEDDSMLMVCVARAEDEILHPKSSSVNFAGVALCV
jgi:hypothetical protein